VRRVVVPLLFAVLTLGVHWPAAAAIGMGETFPEVALPSPQDKAGQAYLGLPAGQEKFTLSQVDARVVLVELLNVLCPHCRKQTKPYNQLFQLLQQDPVTRGKVKMLGVAVANSHEQIDDFVTVYGVAFPVVSDERFLLHRALRAGQTPLSLYVLLDPPGQPGIVAGTQLGEDDQVAQLFAYLKDLLTMQRGDFAGLAPEEEAAPLPPPIAGVELEKRMARILRAQGEALADFHQLQLPSARPVWTGQVKTAGGERRLYAVLIGRSAICDVCHDVHFIYLFDRQGRIVAFEPLHLTKYGNVLWDDREIEQLRHRVVGRRLDGNWRFDPQVDAVTSATMTSAIIFDSLGLGEGLLQEIRAAEVRSESSPPTPSPASR